MLPGLQQGQEKMSKSDPSSSVFMEDEEVSTKAYQLSHLVAFSFVYRTAHFFFILKKIVKI